MESTLQSKVNNSLRQLPDAVLVILFGLLSDVFSLIQFRIPSNENVYSDLREIPLLIGILYLRNPFLIVFCCLFSPLTYIIGVPYFPTVVMHILPLLAIAWFYQLAAKSQNSLSPVSTGLRWLAVCMIYYLALLFPNSITTYRLFDMDNGESFGAAYVSLTKASVYELTATSLITVLYVIQFEMAKSLKRINVNLEKMVEERTYELTQANRDLQTLNEELVSSNEEIKSLNDNLERIVADRTKKINDQLGQLSKYAHMNSHEVRAPLARILGLLNLVKMEESKKSLPELIEKLAQAGNELDDIIKKMNRLLEDELQ